MAKLQVVVIGAGAGGLAMCRHLASEPQVDFVAFEKACGIGGIWRYTKDGDPASGDNHTPMYKNLRTNLPKEVMAYPDFPFPKELRSFIMHGDVLSYLETYAGHFDVMKYIKFNHKVLSVKPLLGNKKEKPRWEVVVEDLRNETIHSHVFDAVVVCIGHFSVPQYPEIPGRNEFPGSVIHSSSYDEPEDYRDKNVIVLGAANSGLDITMDLADVCKKIYLVHLKDELPTKFPENVQQVTGTITACFSNGNIEINNEEVLRNVDAMIFCTGYHYSFPFLAPECGIKVTNNRVTSLYKHIFCTKLPSLAFIGLGTHICPFPHFSIQAQCILSVLSGRTVLPSLDDMVKDEQHDYEDCLKRGVPENRLHMIGADRQMAYCEMITEIAGLPCSLTKAVESLFVHIIKIRTAEYTTMKNMDFVIEGDEWHEVEINETKNKETSTCLNK